MEKVFITGGSGLLGSHIIRELLDRNYAVCALIEPGTDPFTIANLPIQKAQGNILDPESYKHLLTGCDYLIHAAASTAIWPTRSEQIREINLKGTQNMCTSAMEAGIKKIIHVGTANSFGSGTKDHPGDEETPFNAGSYNLEYINSKYLAHQWIMDRVKDQQMPVTVVNPTFMIGPFDSRPSSGEMIRSFYLGKIPGVTPGGRNFIYAGDAAVGVVNALEKGKIGESYILGNQNMNYPEFFSLLGSVLNKKPPTRSVPKWLMMGVAHINALIANTFRLTPRTFPAMVKIAYDEQFFSPAKAIREIDLPQTPVSQAVKECFTWLKENKYL